MAKINKKEQNMKLEQLMSTEAWTPLKDVCSDYEHIEDFLYKVGDNLYVIAHFNNKDLVYDLPDAPFVVLACWAVSPEAAKRSIFINAEENICKLILPPKELLLGSNGSYGELTTLHKGKTFESASYNSKGIFIYKTIQCLGFEYCFMNRGRKLNEMPFAIKIRLPVIAK